MNGIWHEALSIWQSGGWAMTVLALNAFILFSLGLAVRIRLWEKEYRHVPEKKCKVWIENPKGHKESGTLHRLVELVMNSRSKQQMALLFKEFRQDEIAPFARDMRILRVCVSASPLLGLLGTVSGMLTMFHALSMGSGGEQTLGMVASGISEALVTTETGLIIALPGLFFLHHLQQEIDGYEAFLARLETGCAQSIQRMVSGPTVLSELKVAALPFAQGPEVVPTLKAEIVQDLQRQAA